MDQINEQENMGGPIDPNFDFSAYLFDLEVPSEVPLEGIPETAPVMQLVHDLKLEEIFALDFDLYQPLEYTPIDDPLPATKATFERSPVRPPELVIPSTVSAVGPHYENGMYRNRILNSFKSPDVALSVIDNLRYPFDDELQSALEKALEHQRPESDRQYYALEATLRDALEKEFEALNQEPVEEAMPDIDAPYGMVNDNLQLQVPIYEIQTRLAPTEPTEPIVKKGKNRRSQNRLNFDPLKYYQPLATKPASWGPKTRSGEDLFRYTAKGELLPELLLTIEQIGHFIQFNPLNYINGNAVPDPKNSGLILWIQAVPADSGSRYGNSVSGKCRVKDCPEPHNTIWKGDFRVAFDEQSSQHPKVDPFHCAGYAHLYCMEKFFDFPQICRTYNVQPDTRAFVEGRNKMAITRDHPGMLDVVENYIQGFSWPRPRPQNEYKHYLNCKLTKYHLQMQPSQKQADRNNRASNSSIDVTLNDLEVYVRNKALQNADKKSNSARRIRKRKLPDISESDESELDNDILSRDMVGSRALKRAKVNKSG